jgi:hypothetical protein
MTIRLRRLFLVAVLCTAGAWGQSDTGAAKPAPSNQRIATGGRSVVGPPKAATSTHSLVRPQTILGGPTVTLLGSVKTTSPAESFALSGNLAYVCDDNEISVIDVTNPLNPQIVATAVSSLIQNSADIHCDIQRNTLTIFSDQVSSVIGNTPAFVAFSLTNPLQPQLIKATPLDKRFFEGPVYIGNFAFVPTLAITYFFGIWDSQFGDLISVDLTNFSNPLLAGTLEQPQLSAELGGSTSVIGATQADTSLLYLGGTTSTGSENNGVGRLQTVDVTNPANMQLVGQLMIPGTVQFYAPLIQGTVAVGIGNNGGYVGSLSATTINKGNIIIATFDVSDRRAPAILSVTPTIYSVGAGGGAAIIGNSLFAFAGVQDASGNPILLVVDATNPAAPVVRTFPLSQPFTSMQPVGSTLYATLGSGGFATYSIPGTSGPATICPASIDAMLVVDRGTAMSSQAFLNAKAALESFVDALHLAPDQVGVASFTNTASVNQTLITNGPQAKAVVDGLISGAASYIGAGIAAAQAELTGTRHIPSATPVMIVLSDGADKGAPNNTATLAAANAAKVAGIRIIAIQYGPPGSTLMQSIASSNTDYYLVSQ